jgi:hypothetical protein
MFSFLTSVKLSRSIAVSSLLMLAACGGGGSSAPDPAPSSLGLAANYTDLAEGATVGKATWQNGSGNGQPIDGVICAPSEAYHVHAVVSIYQNGVRLALPAQIGLQGCAYELHTHDSTGIVHLEAASQKPFTLGQFFAVWGQTLSNTNVAGMTGSIAFYIIENGKVTPFSGDPTGIALGAHKEIAIVVGTPPAALDKNRLPSGF